MTLIIVVVIALLLYVIVAYNGMIKMRNQVKEAWADIDVQLKRRYNLIPNIVETVKGYATHEEGVLIKVTEARANAINATNIKDQSSAENMLSGALKSLFAVAENYPQLKANENFLQLQNELVDTEDKIQSARRFYNSVTRDFNTKIQQVPAKFVAQMFKFMAEDFFEIENEEEKENVEVDFDKDKEAATATGAEKTDDKPAEKEEEKSEEPKEEAPTEETKEEEKAEKPEEPKEEEKKEEPAEEAKEEEEKPAEEEPKEEAPAEEPKEEEKKEEEKPEESKEEEKKEETPAEESKEEAPAEEPKDEGKKEESEQNALPLEHSDDEKKE